MIRVHCFIHYYMPVSYKGLLYWYARPESNQDYMSKVMHINHAWMRRRLRYLRHKALGRVLSPVNTLHHKTGARLGIVVSIREVV